ncbi:unnamed protein product, partial [Candidula unifasciata]
TATVDAGGLCEDLIPNCRSYGQQTCVDYADWSKINCPYTCGFCTGSPPQRECKDLVDNCQDYVPEMCTDSSYRIWAEDNCPAYCDFCGTTNTVAPTGSSQSPATPSASICEDLINFCSVYSQLACSDTTWANTYCSKYCNRC